MTAESSVKSLGLIARDSPHQGKWDLASSTNSLSISGRLCPGCLLDQNLPFTVKVNNNNNITLCRNKLSLRTKETCMFSMYSITASLCTQVLVEAPDQQDTLFSQHPARQLHQICAAARVRKKDVRLNSWTGRRLKKDMNNSTNHFLDPICYKCWAFRAAFLQMDFLEARDKSLFLLVLSHDAYHLNPVWNYLNEQRRWENKLSKVKIIYC